MLAVRASGFRDVALESRFSGEDNALSLITADSYGPDAVLNDERPSGQGTTQLATVSTTGLVSGHSRLNRNWNHR